MAQMMTAQEHLKAFADEIKTAAKKQDTDAKAAVKAAIKHLDEAREEREAQLKSDRAIDKARVEKAITTFKKLHKKTDEALHEKGEAFVKELDKVAAEADAALENI